MDEGFRTNTGVEQKGGEGIYLFCFARPMGLPAIEGTGVDGRNPVSSWAFPACAASVAAGRKDVVAVVSKVALEEFCGPAAESNMQDLTWVGPRACRHEEVIERVMRYSPVFPTRFGTLFSSLESLGTLVEKHYGTISEFLDYVADKEEWAVKGLLDRARAEEQLLALTLSQRSGSLPSSAGARYLQEQQLRDEVGKELRSWVKTVSSAMAKELIHQAVESRELKLLPREGSGRDMDMVLNWAFLLLKNAREDFRARIEQVGAEYSKRGVILELSGPWPPYSFRPSLALN